MVDEPLGMRMVRSPLLIALKVCLLAAVMAFGMIDLKFVNWS